MQKRWAYFFLAIFGAFTYTFSVYAADMSSPNFKNLDSSFAPATFSESSANFTINASIEPIVDASISANFAVRHGIPMPSVTPPPVTPPPPSGGGGGGGGGIFPPSAVTTTPVHSIVPPPTLDYRGLTFKSHLVLRGNRTNSSDHIQVNGSTNGVELEAGLAWRKDLPLFVGYNDIRVQEGAPSGALSVPVVGQIERMLIGDSTRGKGATFHHVVDDVDLSIFTRAWKKYDFFSDFNEDTIIDDADLSLLVSHWGVVAEY